MKFRIQDKWQDRKEISLYRTETPDDVATLAQQFIERWGLVSAVPDGEDSSGRQKMRLPTSQELVARAFDIAEEVWAQARSRGHVVTLPDLMELNAEEDAKQQAKREAQRA